MNICIVDNCDKPIRVKKHGWCSMHYMRWLRHGDVNSMNWMKPRPITEPRLNENGYLIIKIHGKKKFHHRYVMEQHLGRELLPNENVHHINGDTADNRIENLELWNTSQPPGQRIEDKVAWAKEILALYDPESLTLT